MHRVDPEGVVLRWREAIQQRKYRVSSPLALWHIDGNHKLIRYACMVLYRITVRQACFNWENIDIYDI